MVAIVALSCVSIVAILSLTLLVYLDRLEIRDLEAKMDEERRRNEDRVEQLMMSLGRGQGLQFPLKPRPSEPGSGYFDKKPTRPPIEVTGGEKNA